MQRGVLSLSLVLLVGCPATADPDTGVLDGDAPADARADAPELDAPSDAPQLDAADAPTDAAAPCCVASHFASFVIPSTPGSGLPHEARYTVSADLVVDEVTGLTWQLPVDGVRRNLDEAIAYCDALELGGRDDFHLPTRIELVTLLELERSPTIAAALLPTEAEYHRTSSRYAARPESAYSVYFGAGAIELGRGEARSALARCVAAPAAAMPGLGPVVDGDTAYDAATRLRWGRAAMSARTYAEAESACRVSGQALPTLRELASILDDARTAPAIDVAVLGTPAGPTWTSSRTTSSGERWIIDLNDGHSEPRSESAMAAVRCVMR